MVRTGARAQALEELLVRAGLRPAARPPSPRVDDLSSETAERVVALYRDLGGQEVPARLRPGIWDLAFEDGLIIELDEQLHFNRYRALTLHVEWAEALPWRNDYVAYCRDREGDCLADGQWGRRWTNASCERMFGPADSPGAFGQWGAPRWKQRALYDAIKDAFAICGRVHLARLAVHDQMEGIELAEILERRVPVETNALLRLVDSRVIAR